MGSYGKRLQMQQTQRTSTTHDPCQHDQDNSTNNTRPTGTTETHDQRRGRHQRRRQNATHPLSTDRQLNIHFTKATTSSTLVRKAATRVPHDTPILCATHPPSRHRCKTTLFHAARDLSGTPCLIYRFALSEFPLPTREEPRAQALWSLNR